MEEDYQVEVHQEVSAEAHQEEVEDRQEVEEERGLLELTYLHSTQQGEAIN